MVRTCQENQRKTTRDILVLHSCSSTLFVDAYSPKTRERVEEKERESRREEIEEGQ
jgi:hypothetical protein